jgi:hypothetical protein
MLTKSRTLALGVAIAGAIGLGAPVANAVTLPGSNAVTSATSLLGTLGCTQVVPGSTLGGSGAVVNALSGATTALAGAQAIVKGLFGGATVTSIPAGTTCGMVVGQLQTVCAESKSVGPLSALASLAASHGLSVTQLKALCAGSLPANVVPTTLVPTTLVPTTLVPATLVPATLVPATLVPATLVPNTTVPSLPGISGLTDPLGLFAGLTPGSVG